MDSNRYNSIESNDYYFAKRSGNKRDYWYKLVDALEENLEMVGDFIQMDLPQKLQESIIGFYCEAQEKISQLTNRVGKVLEEDFIDEEARISEDS